MTPPVDHEPADVGAAMYRLIAELYPICRSRTGPGVRETLRHLAGLLPLEIHEIPSGTRAFDWTVPREWIIRDAWIDDPTGRRVVDFRRSNLHVVGYSVPFQGVLSLDELRPHLHTLADQPDWVPYRTTYHVPDWGFCMSRRQYEALVPGQYAVRVDSTLADGSLTYGECFLPGRSSDEVLISTHVCHPSLCNDNLSGIAVAAFLARQIAARRRRLSYRFLFVPATLGPIVWLSRNRERLSRIRHGLVLTLVGDRGPAGYKRSRRGNAEIDRAFEHVLRHAEKPYELFDFVPWGYDERQYCSPGFDLPVGCFLRTPYTRFAQYHSSADNLDAVDPAALADSLGACLAAFDVLEENRLLVGRVTKGEPRLGCRGLYVTGQAENGEPPLELQAIQWALNLADGRHSTLDAAQRAGLPFSLVRSAVEQLADKELLAPPPADGTEDDGANGPAEAGDLRARAHRVIPGGCHTYAKGDDQYPADAPPFLVRGEGCHVWDAAGKRYIEYGAGLRSVTLGHAYPAVLEAACRQMALGANFVRPSPIEVQCAERLAELVPVAEMVKFAKNGSDATTAAVKLARAYTGRDLVAICGDQPFLSTDDWFIGHSAMNAGIPEAVRRLTVAFHYNDLDSVAELFERFPGQIACLVMEAATATEPAPGFLEQTARLCRQNGTLLVLDEIITGFRWGLGGAQKVYGVLPDLAAFGKGMANGFALSALVGRREIMRLGGLDHDRPRVFLLSTTNGTEHHALAAAMATIDIYRREPVIETLYRQGARLRAGVEAIARQLGIERHFYLTGRDCNLTYATCDQNGERSQAFRTLFLQEIIRRGVIAPSFVVNYSHRDEDIDRTVAAVGEALEVYRRALNEGVEKYLKGPPSKPVLRKYN